MAALDSEKIDGLLGMAATAQDAQNLQPTELRDLVAAVVAAADVNPIDVRTFANVYLVKLDFNKLPGNTGRYDRWRLACILWNVTCPSTTIPSRESASHSASVFATRFQDKMAFRHHNLSLYEDVTGIGIVAPQRQVAAQALLAHLFESCDLLEEPPARRPHDLTGKHLRHDRAMLGIGAR